MGDPYPATTTGEQGVKGQGVLELISEHVNFRLPQSQPGREWLSLPELPTPSELNPGDDPSATRENVMQHLRRNDVSRPYGSRLKYLETHYRLNREEGITFLRFGIGEYKYNPAMMDNENTCVYTKVYVQGYLMTRLGPVCRMQLSTERAGKKIRWQTSQRLTPGTVVAISTVSDSFQSICKPAVIADRPIKHGLERRPPTIQLLWANIEDAVFDPTEELVMIESRRGFFEAVRHTLVGLQHVARSTNPIIKYLVEGSTSDLNPQFIIEKPRMDLTPILHHLPEDHSEKAQLIDSYRNYEVLEGIPDDIGRHTSLDNSQLQAVHRILTKELAIIQGPPGTGKTFTSVESLRCMINSLTAGMTTRPSEPIVVAAETNHAVDQILTHLLAHEIKVVRLGSRTRDEEIKNHNLFNLRNRVMRGRGRDMNNLEAARKRAIIDIEAIIGEMFSTELLEPELLLENGLINREQYNSLGGDEWTWQPAPGKPQGAMSEWLDDSLQDASIRPYQDTLFDGEEIFENDDGDGVDAQDFELDADDPAADTDDNSVHLKGTWLGIARKWAGANPNRYPMDNVHMLRQLKKRDLYEIDEKWRGPIYEYWQSELLSKRRDVLNDLFANYNRICKNIKTSGWKQDTDCIKLANIQVIGCTTTGLSKYRGLLAALKPKTVLVEEAAQSREAHIAAALLPTLEQLILVGDHQQLVPNCHVTGLTDSYHNLTVSMFERLVTYLKLPYTVLNQQRRMISDIRAVLNPFYPDLRDHPSVWDKARRPDVPGMAVNSYLFNHSWPEGTDEESLSKYNVEEARMVVKFAIYLMQNGMAAEQITILTFYRGQRKKILSFVRQLGALHFGQLKIFTVDSYQGEENDIVLLSLVHSSAPNRPNVAGFVGDMNRGVVAISRARRGFYIFGNIKNLEYATDASRFMWGNVRKVFEQLNRYHGTKPHLPLRCQKHGKNTFVDDAEYFDMIHGGCLEKCPGMFQPCGHLCQRFCHPISHEYLICQHPCERRLRCGHSCRDSCGKACRCERSCSDFMGRMKQPIGIFNTGVAKVGAFPEYWNRWDVTAEDATRRSAMRTGSDLIDLGRNNEGIADKVRDKHRRVSVGHKGYRQVGTINLIEHKTQMASISDAEPINSPLTVRPAVHCENGATGSNVPVKSAIAQVGGLTRLTGPLFSPGRYFPANNRPGRGRSRGEPRSGLKRCKRDSKRKDEHLARDRAAPCTLPPVPCLQQVDDKSGASYIARRVNDWEHSESEEEPLNANLQHLNLESGNDNSSKDLITF